MSEALLYEVPEDLITLCPERFGIALGDPHGCCHSCEWCTASFRRDEVFRVLAHQGIDDRRERVWPGPSCVSLVARRYTFLGLRDGFCCRYCAKPLPPWDHTVDHVIPKRQGGGNGQDNLVLACLSCNSRKGARTPEQWRGVAA